MSTEIDPAKMKVVDLRQELSARGLDTKGNKPALVKRLKDALELELKRELPDTSIADTSTEDLDASTVERSESKESNENDDVPPDRKEEESEEQMEAESSEPTTEEKDEKAVSEQNGDQKEAEGEGKESAKTEETDKADGDSPKKGEKRKHSSPSPERAQRRRSKSPVKEDEPVIDEQKVQLSWYDSDLHLRVDKESFLSAKPCNDGAFGYVWAGARATHGVSSGKVHFEVKLTEELKFEDFSKLYDNRKKFENRKFQRENAKKKEKKPAETKEGEEKTEKAENGDVKPEESAEKPAAEEKAPAEQEPMETTAEEKPEEKPAEEAAEAPKEEEKEKTEGEKEKTEGEKEKSEGEKKPEAEGEDAEKAEKEDKEKEVRKNILSHVFRVGWSVISTSLQLGEEEHSYGYESTGKFVTANEFTDFGKAYALNDVVGAYVDINDEFVKFTFTVNDGEPEEALTIPRADLPEEFVLFPHVLSRNYAFEINLGNKEEAWFPIHEALSDYIFIDKAEEKVSGPTRPVNRSDCEVLLMCGLPASGKTHWVKEHVQKNPEKRYTIIGNSHLLEKMTVEGIPLKKCYKGRWSILMDKSQKCLNELLQIAALRRRNYIIDQTNVFPSAQRRKLRPFEGFRRCAVVVVVGDEEQAKRQTLQEAQDGKDMPESAVLELKANMTLPEKNNWIDEVIYSDLPEAEAKEQVGKYNTQGKEAGYGPGSGGRRGGRDDRRKFYNVKRLNNRGGPRFRDRGFERSGGSWYGSRPGGGGGGGGWRDRRDNRGYGGSGGREPWRRDYYSDRGSRDVARRSGGYGQVGRSPWQGTGGGWGQGGSGQGAWGAGQSWSGQGQGTWGGQGQGSWTAQGQGGQWKYGNSGASGQNYGGGYSGGSNWNYYGQYGGGNQGWNNQARRKQ